LEGIRDEEIEDEEITIMEDSRCCAAEAIVYAKDKKYDGS